MEYDLEYFIAKFEAIPEDKWTTRTFDDGNGCYCAYGHCGDRLGKEDGKESMALSKIIMDKGQAFPFHLADINDGNDNFIDEYGSTPKQRVVNYLKSLRTV